MNTCAERRLGEPSSNSRFVYIHTSALRKSLKVSLLHTNYRLNSKVNWVILVLCGKQSKRRKNTEPQTVEKVIEINSNIFPKKAQQFTDEKRKVSGNSWKIKHHAD